MQPLTTSKNPSTATVSSLMGQISSTGRDHLRGGYSRPVYSHAELDLRAWFTEQAAARELSVEQDRNGALWAWWDLPSGIRANAVATGSHLDSVPGGGAFDGPLGVASALVALDILRARDLQRSRPLALVVFPEEEGSRFGVACLGSRLLTGAIDRDKALNLRDPDGNSFADIAAKHGLDVQRIGPDPALLGQLGAFVELHVEQGLGLGELQHPVAVGGSILGHGRWKLSLAGQGNHAGTTLMRDRRDPMVAAARTIAAVQQIARAQDNARATVGRLQPVPGGTNVIASRVDFWLDVRHPDDAVAGAVVQDIHQAAQVIAAEEGCGFSFAQESFSPTVDFDARLSAQLGTSLGGIPVLDTGAGHDAGVLAGHVPSAMLFVRNPSGISHSPEEYVEDADAERGAAALADALQDLLA